MSRKILFYVFLSGMIILLGCSSNSMNPVDPASENPGLYGAGSSDGADAHILWGAFRFYIDADNQIVEVVPDRLADPHFNVTSYVKPPACDDCVTIVMKNFDKVTRIAEVEVTLRNPTEITGYDVRGILLLNDAGFDIKNADGWTQVYDDGKAPYFNPFKRFAKSIEFGAFAAGESFFETYMIYIPKPPKYSELVYVVDAIYPKNSFREPYDIAGEQVDGPLYTDGSNTVTLTVWVFDRNDDALKVTVECPQIFDGTKDMTQQSDPKVWEVQFSNEKLGAAGNYNMTVEAFDTKVSYTLRDKVQVNVIEKSLFWSQNVVPMANGSCSYDIAAADGGSYDGGGYLVNSQSECTGFYGYNQGFSIPAEAVDLVDINPLNSTLQPYPPERYDSAFGGGLAFSNTSTDNFSDGLNNVVLSRVVVCLDGTLIFQDDTAGDDSAHYPAGHTTLSIADLCDGFQSKFYILWAENGGTDLPIVRCYADNFTTKKQKIGVKIPNEFIGTGDGKIVNDAATLIAIDANELDKDNVELYILEKTGTSSQVEVFNLKTNSSTGNTEVTYLRTFNLASSLGEACDLELLPPNPDYQPNPDAVNIVVPFRIEKETSYSGYINIYDSQTGALVEGLGNPDMPTLFENVRHMDVNNSTFSIIVTSEIMEPELINMVVFIFTYM